ARGRVGGRGRRWRRSRDERPPQWVPCRASALDRPEPAAARRRVERRRSWLGGCSRASHVDLEHGTVRGAGGFRETPIYTVRPEKEPVMVLRPIVGALLLLLVAAPVGAQAPTGTILGSIKDAQ